MNALAAPLLAAFLLAVPLLAVPAGASAAAITVSAAASLKEAFCEVAEAFREASGVAVHLNFASSNTLLRQIRNGAPVDVFASADQTVMDEAARGAGNVGTARGWREEDARGRGTAGNVGNEGNAAVDAGNAATAATPAPGKALILPETRRDFAANQLVLITPAAGRPAPGLDALRDPVFSRIAIGTPQSVPAGRYAREAMERADLWDALAPRLIFGNNVRQVLTYVQRGEADAGIVYRTDALNAGDAVRTVATRTGAVRIDAELTGRAAVTYPIAVTSASPSPEEARRFIDYLLSPAGQATLARHGFSPLR